MCIRDRSRPYSLETTHITPSAITVVTVVRKGKVRRAKLFYLRGRTGKAAKVKSDI